MPVIPARKSFWGELLVYLMARRSIWRSFHGLYFRAAAPLPQPFAKVRREPVGLCVTGSALCTKTGEAQ